MDAKLQKVLDDFELFSKNFIHITDNNNDVIKFELNQAQKEIHEMMGKNKFIIISKARQAGISTFSLGKALWRALTKPNENILIVSYKSDSAKALFEKLKDMNDRIPRDKFPNVFPDKRRDNRDELLFSNGSKIKSIVAGTKDIGRGDTYTWIHLSEFAFFTNQEKQLLSVEQSLAKGANSQLTIETTSNGTGNHYYKLYMQAMKGKSKYVDYFIPFYHKLYSKQFTHDYYEAEAWYKAVNKGRRLSKEDLDDVEEKLHEMGATLRQLMWRQWKLSDMDGEEQFQQEYPSTPLESFISTGNSVFNQSMVLQKLSFADAPLTRAEMKEIDNLPEIMNLYIGRGFEIFELPQKGVRYYAGVDTASGSGKDFSTISLFNEEGSEVATFYNNKIPVYKFAEVANVLGRWYNYAFLTVERNSYGLPVIERLRKDYHYLNMFKQKLFDQQSGKKKLKLGFLTTEVSKAIMVSDMKEQFECSMINIQCKETLQQMQMFVENNGKTGNKQGSTDAHHDDLVISTALAIQGMKLNKWYV